MSIKPSASAEVRTLVQSLLGADDIKREAAIARLAVIGPRAVDRLLAEYAQAPSITARVAILRTLEAIGDPRALPIARAALHDGGEVGVAAAAALRPLLDSENEATAAQALDALVSVSLAHGAGRQVRLASLAALKDMPRDLRERVTGALAEDPDPVVRAAVLDHAGDEGAHLAEWNEALQGRIGDDPSALLAAAQARAASAPLGDIRKLIDAVRAREEASGGDARTKDWRALRGALHRALAARASTVALYDLRESIAGSSRPLPVAFVDALALVGDDSCLEPIASAWTAARTDPTGHDWRRQLESAFAAIVKREKLTRRSAVMKRISTRWPGILTR